MPTGKPPEAADPFPEVLTPAQVRFELSFALHEVAKAPVWEWARTDRLKKEAARERITDKLFARFDRLQVRGPASSVSLFADRVTGREDSDT